MPDITHQFVINGLANKVFEAICTPTGLDSWWTKRSSGDPRKGATYELWFGPEYDWRAVVSQCVADGRFELKMVESQADWLNTRVDFRLAQDGGATTVRFCHSGWPAANEHFQISSYCWAMYLRLLRRYVESGEIVPYEKRLDV